MPLDVTLKGAELGLFHALSFQDTCTLEIKSIKTNVFAKITTPLRTVPLICANYQFSRILNVANSQ